MKFWIYAILVGTSATLVLDLWSIVRRRLFGIALPDYALVGRWFAWMPRGRFRHEAIKAVPPVRGERLIGWGAHYLIGMGFAALLLKLCGLRWMASPTLAPALGVGLATVLAPFLLMQPGMGAGLAARRTPNPAAARRQSLITHAVFGLGLYAAGWGIHLSNLP